MAVPIYVIGSSNTDLVVKTEKLPKPGETVMGDTFMMTPGGKGANQAVSAARLGGQITLVANVGNDIFGQHALKQYQHEGIHDEFITTDTQHPTGVALIGVDANGENNIIVAPGANSFINLETVGRALDAINTDAIILLQLEIPINVVEFVIGRTSKAGLRVILNPAPAASINQELYKYLYLITPNEYEAEVLTGIRVTDTGAAEVAAKRLHELGVMNSVITMGSQGAMVYNGSDFQLIKAPKVKAIDTTAAGDCFNGALAVGLSEGMHLDKAVTFACNAAALSVTRMGAQASLPYRKDVDALIN
jgi:ribokinase